MVLPQFTQTGVTDFVFSKGPEYGEQQRFLPNQRLTYSEAGQVRVATLQIPEEILPLHFERLPKASVDLLLAFLQDPLVNWAAHPFTYMDVDSVSWTVRLIDSTFTRLQTAYRLYTVTLTLRREIP